MKDQKPSEHRDGEITTTTKTSKTNNNNNNNNNQWLFMKIGFKWNNNNKEGKKERNTTILTNKVDWSTFRGENANEQKYCKKKCIHLCVVCEDDDGQRKRRENNGAQKESCLVLLVSVRSYWNSVGMINVNRILVASQKPLAFCGSLMCAYINVCMLHR